MLASGDFVFEKGWTNIAIKSRFYEPGFFFLLGTKGLRKPESLLAEYILPSFLFTGKWKEHPLAQWSFVCTENTEEKQPEE